MCGVWKSVSKETHIRVCAVCCMWGVCEVCEVCETECQKKPVPIKRDILIQK